MNNKEIYEKWLITFKRNSDGKKFKAVKAYMKYMKTLEKDLGMGADEIFTINTIKELKQKEAKLRKKPKFLDREPKERANLLSALHVYENLIDILSSKVVRKKS
jgi:hypothetical protein